jgi:hypothetical protein
VVVHLPTPHATGDGRLAVQPGVEILSGDSESAWADHAAGGPLRPSTPRRKASFRLSSLRDVFAGPQPELAPAPHVIPSTRLAEDWDQGAGEAEAWEEGLGEEGLAGEPEQAAEPMFGRLLSEAYFGADRRGSRWDRLLRLLRPPPHCDVGVGRERLAFAPFQIDVAQPLASNIRLRFDAAYNLTYPDRAEYFYGKGKINTFTGQTPQAGRFDSIDYQDIRILMEFGGPKLTVGTEIPIRILDPESQGANTAGLSDMNITTKTVLLDGNDLQITQIFRTYLNTGAPTHGLGTGHVSLEPGLLFRLKWDETLYLHSELKYWFPIGGDPNHSGQILRYGVGTSHVAYETDSMALIPTLELVAWSVLDGRESNGNLVGPSTNEVDGLTILNASPGLRLVMDRGGDLGLLELGVFSSFAISGPRWYESLLRFDCRWSF